MITEAAQERGWTPHLPFLKWPYYWHIDVTSGPDCHIHVSLKRRYLLLFRTSIEHKGKSYLIMKAGEEFTIEHAHAIREKAEEIYDNRFNQRDIIYKLSTYFPGAKVTKS